MNSVTLKRHPKSQSSSSSRSSSSSSSGSSSSSSARSISRGDDLQGRSTDEKTCLLGKPRVAWLATAEPGSKLYRLEAGTDEDST